MTDKELETAAGNGLINRRHLLGLGLAGMGAAVANSALAADASMRLEIPAWSKSPGPGATADPPPLLEQRTWLPAGCDVDQSSLSRGWATREP